MSPRNPFLTDAVDNYIRGLLVEESAIARRLREETAQLPQAHMQISADQGAFLGLLVKILGAKTILEVGTFTGYSALCMASALPEGGKLTACDVSEKWTSIGRRYWKEAGIEERIDLHLAPATETLALLIALGYSGKYDFAFLDADKPGYDSYYESALTLLRSGGVIALDNMLWSGAVADASDNEPDTKVIRDLNTKISHDKRVESVLLSIADGVMLVRKK